jgi:hypothetical protein
MRSIFTFGTLWSVIALLNLTATGFAQTISLIQPIDTADLRPDQNAAVQALRSLPTTQDLQVVRVDPRALTLNQEIKIGFKSGTQFPIKNFSKSIVGGKLVAWSGAAASGSAGSTTFAVHDDNLTGAAQTPEGTYRIWPIGNGLSALVKVDMSKMPPEHPPSFSEKVTHADPLPTTGNVPGVGAPPTTITVLVAYTPAVANKIGVGIPGLVTTSIAETNQSYKNSGININLASATATPIQINYTETGSMEADVAAFSSNPDVARARAASNANLAVLLVANGEYCGWSQQILATNKTAFSVVYFDCAMGPQYSFGHEIGHLQGARHNPEADPASAPFVYGHGFLDVANKRRTIMAYDCDTQDCTRAPEWARPTTWGNATVSNDARALNETAAYIAGLH